MKHNPVDNKPVGSFAEFVNAEPIAAAAVDTFKVALSSNGVQLGWLGKTDGDWAILVTDSNQALTLELYPYDSVNYYRIKGTSRYLSVSNQAYIGFYNWNGARGWTLQNQHLISDDNNQKLSLYSKDNGYLYAWDKYTVLEVTFDSQ